MKNIILGALALIVCASANATPTYFLDTFDTDSVIALNGNSALTVTGKSLNTKAEQWHIGGNGTEVSIENGKLNFNETASDATTRSALIFVDTSGFKAGDYAVSFTISDFNITLGADGHVGASILDFAGLTSADDKFNFDLGNAAYKEPIFSAEGNTTFSTLNSINFNDNGTFDVAFTLTEDGVAGDFLGISIDRIGGTGSFSVDSVSVIPEPATLGLLGLAGAGLMAYRRRRG